MGGGPQERAEPKPYGQHFADGSYWARRSDQLYYRYVDYIVRVVGARARSMIDVGTGGCPYLEWFDWIPERVSMDLASPYESEAVRGITGNLIEHDFGGRRFDLCTCLQVLEHVPDAAPFARRLLEVADVAVVSVPYKWPRNAAENHVHDPVDEAKLAGWMGREPNYSIVVREPFTEARKKGRRLIAVYDQDPARTIGRPEVRGRRKRVAAT